MTFSSASPVASPVASRTRLLALCLSGLALVALTACAAGPRQETAGQYIDDTTVTARVKTAIYQDPLLKSAEINVETFKGRVQLSGFVSSSDRIDRAVVVAKSVTGVTSVGNDMRLK